MENFLTIADYVNEKMRVTAESNKPQWARSKKEINALRYAKAYMENETWLNSIEALFHRYGINNTNQSESYV